MRYAIKNEEGQHFAGFLSSATAGPDAGPQWVPAGEGLSYEDIESAEAIARIFGGEPEEVKG